MPRLSGPPRLGRRALLAGVGILAISTANAAEILIGNRPLLTSSGHPITTQPVGALTSLVLTDFQSSWHNAVNIAQRTAGTTTGNVPLLFTYTGGLVRVQGRAVDATTGAVVLDWTTLTNAVIGGGNGLGTLPGVPQGTNYVYQIRDGVTQPTSGPLFSAGTTKCGVGCLFLVGGQSNQVGTWDGDYTRPVPGTGGQPNNNWLEDGHPTWGAFFGYNGWTGMGLGSGQYGPSSGSDLYSGAGNCAEAVRLIGTALFAKYGKVVPVGFITWAFNANYIGLFLPPLAGAAAGGNWTNLFGGTGSTQGSFGLASARNVFVGDFEGFFWYQGEADFGQTTAQYAANLQTLCQGMVSYVAAYGRSPSQLLLGIVVLGNYGVASAEAVRQAGLQFVSQATAGTLPGQAAPWTGAMACSTTIDIPRANADGSAADNTANTPRDAYHINSNGGTQRSFNRQIQTILWWLGASTNGPSGLPFSGRGPVLQPTYTRVSATVDRLYVQMEGGTTLAPPTPGSPITGFYVNTAADFSGSAVPYATITVGALSGGVVPIDITYPGGTTTTRFIKHMGGRSGDTSVDANGFNASMYPDIRNPLYDNVSYPTSATGADVETLGLPLQPSLGALVAG